MMPNQHLGIECLFPTPFFFWFSFSHCPQSEDGNLVFNPGATLAVEIPAKLLIANASSAGTDGGSAAAAPAATIDVAEKMNMMFEQLAEMKGDLAAANGKITLLFEENTILKADSVVLKADNVALTKRVDDLEAAEASGASASELVDVKGNITSLAADVTALQISTLTDIDALEAGYNKLNASAAAVGTACPSVTWSSAGISGVSNDMGIAEQSAFGASNGGSGFPKQSNLQELGVLDSSWTISVDIKARYDGGSNGATGTRFLFGNSKPPQSFHIGTTNGKLSMSWTGGGACISAESISSGWSSVAFVYDKFLQMQSIYLNGELIKSCPSTPYIAESEPFYFGRPAYMPSSGNNDVKWHANTLATVYSSALSVADTKAVVGTTRDSVRYQGLPDLTDCGFWLSPWYGKSLVTGGRTTHPLGKQWKTCAQAAQHCPGTCYACDIGFTPGDGWWVVAGQNHVACKVVCAR